MRNKKNIDFDRGKELLKKFTEKEEIYKDKPKASLEDPKEISAKEVERNKKLGNINEYNYNINNPNKAYGYNADLNKAQSFGGFSRNGNEFSNNPSFGHGATVNSIVNDGDAQNNELRRVWGTKYSLKPAEAIIVALKRTLESGNPVNNLSFYDEVNLNLNKMGFDSKSALDIKQVLLKIIEDKI